MPHPFLIADDSPGKRAFLHELLRHEHWDGDIIEATTTEDAMDMIEEHPDIVAAFIDYEIPSQNGPAIIRALHSKNPAAHIALVTASDSRKYEQDGYEAGANAFVCTTWEENRVIKVLTDLLREWHSKDNSSSQSSPK